MIENRSIDLSRKKIILTLPTYLQQQKMYLPTTEQAAELAPYFLWVPSIFLAMQCAGFKKVSGGDC